jgi:hypothetical protein
LNGQPALSVVVASVNGPALLDPTLDALDALPDRDAIEVVVVETTGEATRGRLARRRRPLTIVAVDRREPIPQLRAKGVEHSRGHLVAIVEDHVRVDPGWSSAIRGAHFGDVAAVGGPVENGKPGLVNWAAFFCEYARYMGPVPDGPTGDLPGNNVAYKRDDLLRHLDHLRQGRWESWIHDALLAEGRSLIWSGRAVVHHAKPFALGHFLSQRFLFCRAFAGMRRTSQSWPKRLVYGFGSLALPALLLARTTRTVLAKRRHLGQFLSALPLIGLFFTVGAFGEMAGYLVGPGGSLERVE